MQEKLIHFIWQNLLFDTNNLKAVDGESVQIIHRGLINTHAGPDFNNAKIKIDNTVWAGNIEIHIKSSDWKIHGHTSDKMYDTTILHVCWEYDLPIQRTDTTRICCLELKNRINFNLLAKYESLMHSANEIPCSSMLDTIDEFTWILFQERLVAERMQQKSELINEDLFKTKHDWQEVFYKFMAKNFGLKINTMPFENLANLLSLKLLSRHKDSLLQTEALIFGVAGFLDDEPKDEYQARLKKEFKFLKHKYDLQSMEKVNWKFMRLMPANFPTLRLAQFAALIHQSNNLFSKLMECTDLVEMRLLLNAVPGEYWNTHYQLGELSNFLVKNPGVFHINNIIINTVIPFKFAYSKFKDDEEMRHQTLDLLGKMNPESNIVIKNWEKLGVKAKNSLQTQALLQLKNEYCSNKMCLDCNIGYKLLKNETH